MDLHMQDSPSGETAAAALSASGNGGPSRRKAKAPHEYSTNPSTLRVRRRNATLTPYRREVERAKSNDLKAVSAAWKERVKTETYLAAPEHKKKKILEEVEKEVMDRRRRRKIDTDSKISFLNQKYKPDETVPAPRSGLVVNKVANPMPEMAPPGYVPFPTQLIPDLMAVPKNGPSLQSNPTTPASASASVEVVTQVQDNMVESTSEAPTNSVTSHRSPEVDSTIEILQKQLKAEKRHYEEERRRHIGVIQEVRGIIEIMQVELQQIATSLDFPLPSTYNYTPTPTRMPTSSYMPHFIPLPTPQPTQQFNYRKNNNIDNDNYTNDLTKGYTKYDPEAW
ncbi:hypothetical protein E0Z10_g9514 [Xylaria hypoxylon]|uniref:Uncharacterized protein n=1 Tax=Xylaria hypoxylon TaxID=37992 RepID=A0A4Z0YKT5_9PEZI|nr:hypothetical protein E0Z10_g9514 [Xylaria hypoxylon]